jgi:hypothetical protein
MTTAMEYRNYAQECMASAREATSDPIRKQFLDLARLWMTAAELLDGRTKLPKLQKLNGSRPPGPAS